MDVEKWELRNIEYSSRHGMAEGGFFWGPAAKIMRVSASWRYEASGSSFITP